MLAVLVLVAAVLVHRAVRSGAVPVSLADHGVDVPSVVGGGIDGIDDDALVELDVASPTSGSPASTSRTASSEG